MLSIDKLRFMRQHYGLRQADIADYIGKSLSYVKKVESYKLDISEEAHDKWLECCRLQVRSTKKNRDWS
jgi:transcriptional regulator with XRE-family HTH domain